MNVVGTSGAGKYTLAHPEADDMPGYRTGAFAKRTVAWHWQRYLADLAYDHIRFVRLRT